MPRENVHWSVLENAFDQANRSGLPAIFSAIKKHPEATHLGAMAHDAPYYYKFGDAKFSEVAAWLHGSARQDTFLPLRKLAERFCKINDTNDRLSAFAFLLGMVSHYATDIVFHPLVFYFTGDYHDLNPEKRAVAQAKHRLLETYFDLWFVRSGVAKPKQTFAKFVNSWGSGFDKVTTLLDQELNLRNLPGLNQEGLTEVANWKSAIMYLTNLDKIFSNNLAGMLMRVVNILAADRLRSIDALFLFGRTNSSDYFSNPLTYQNPYSGEERTVTLLELRDEAVQSTLELWKHFEPIIAGESSSVVESANFAQSDHVLLSEIKGKSLDVGIPGANSNDAKYYSKTCLPLPGLD